jgi:hypothetical protein
LECQKLKRKPKGLLLITPLQVAALRKLNYLLDVDSGGQPRGIAE